MDETGKRSLIPPGIIRFLSLSGNESLGSQNMGAIDRSVIVDWQ